MRRQVERLGDFLAGEVVGGVVNLIGDLPTGSHEPRIDVGNERGGVYAAVEAVSEVTHWSSSSFMVRWMSQARQ